MPVCAISYLISRYVWPEELWQRRAFLITISRPKPTCLVLQGSPFYFPPFRQRSSKKGGNDKEKEQKRKRVQSAWLVGSLSGPLLLHLIRSGLSSLLNLHPLARYWASFLAGHTLAWERREPRQFFRLAITCAHG